jgi:hypothetical protein
MASERPPSLPLGGPTQVFDPPGTVFNGTGPVREPHHYVRRVPEEAGRSSKPAWAPSVRTSFANAGDVTAPQVNAGAPKPPAYEALTGSFSGVRAAQSLRQHQIDFWGESAIVEHVMAAPGADPSSTQIDQMYSDLQLFSYMPADMLPSKEEFADQVTPSRAAAAARMQLVTAGIITNNNWSQPQPATEPTPMITASPPFADKLTDWCASRSFIQQTNWF